MRIRHAGVPERAQNFTHRHHLSAHRVSLKSRPLRWSVTATDCPQRVVEYVRSGQLLLREDGEERCLRQGSVLLCFRGGRFTLAAHGGASESLAVYNATLRHEPVSDRCIVLAPCPELAHLAQQVLAAIGSGGASELDRILAAGDLLAARATQLAEAELVPPVRRASAWLALARELLEGQADSDLPLRRILASVPIPYPTLRAALRRALGMSPREYRIRCRVARAQELLGGTQDDMTSLALTLGYSSAQHFATEFRRIAGCTPTAWRARGRDR